METIRLCIFLLRRSQDSPTKSDHHHIRPFRRAWPTYRTVSTPTNNDHNPTLHLSPLHSAPNIIRGSHFPVPGTTAIKSRIPNSSSTTTTSNHSRPSSWTVALQLTNRLFLVWTTIVLLWCHIVLVVHHKGIRRVDPALPSKDPTSIVVVIRGLQVPSPLAPDP